LQDQKFERIGGNETIHIDVRVIAPETIEKLRAYSWPGNIRELQNVVKQALLHATGTVLIPAFLPGLSSSPNPAGSDSGAASNEGWPEYRSFICQRLQTSSTGLNAEV
jgi:DNA-binding NtrC family response regulator